MSNCSFYPTPYLDAKNALGNKSKVICYLLYFFIRSMVGPLPKLRARADTNIVKIKRIESGKGNTTTIGTYTSCTYAIQQLRAIGAL